MGLPLVGKEHQRKASTSQVADRKLRAVHIRISGASGSGCSSANHQQSFQPQDTSSNNGERFMGTLLSRRIAAKGDVHARRMQRLCKELDSPTMGKRPAGRNKDRRGGTLATSSGSGGWDQGQTQVRDVGFVFTRCPLGILWPQSHLVGDSVGSGGKRGPSTGVRVSAKRQEAPLFLSLEQVKLGLTKLEFRDQLLVFLDGALGTRRGELGALRWSDCNFDSMSFSVQHSYYWRRGGHLKATKTESSAKVLPMHLALKDALLEWRSQSEYNGPGDFVFPSLRRKGKKPLDLAAILKKKVQPAFAKVGITGVGWHTFRHTVVGRCWQRWENINSRSATTCVTAICM